MIITGNMQNQVELLEETDSEDEFMTEIPITNDKNSSEIHAPKHSKDNALIENKDEISAETTTSTVENKDKPNSEDIDMEEVPPSTKPIPENVEPTLNNSNTTETPATAALLSKDKHKNPLDDVEMMEVPKTNTEIPENKDEASSNDTHMVETTTSNPSIPANIVKVQTAPVGEIDGPKHQPGNVDKLYAEIGRQAPNHSVDTPLSISKMYKAPYMDKFYFTQEAYEAISLGESPNEIIQKMKEATSFASFLNFKKQIGQDKMTERNEKGPRPVDPVKETQIPAPVRNNAGEAPRMGIFVPHSNPTSPKAPQTENPASNTKPAKTEFSLDALLESISDRPADPIPSIEKLPPLPMKRKSRPDKKYPKNNKSERNALSDIEVAAMAAGI
ncbi:hypothetical protein CLU79DRAFT_770853 [Phycomyces nitens]|nr:hypothetical protein CLU79DRAFT_770853 [Phycomyces nitens]